MAENYSDIDVFAFVFLTIAAIWTLVDAGKRKNNRFWWPLGVFFLLGFLLPIYLAKRHLMEGETREGGTGWNVIKNFVLVWTLAWLFVVFYVTIIAEEVGLGFAIFAFLLFWFPLALAAWLLGKFIRKPNFVEKGPSGPLAK